MDGVTTNGVLIMHPQGGFSTDSTSSNDWLEVSVCGATFRLHQLKTLTDAKNEVFYNNRDKKSISFDIY